MSVAAFVISCLGLVVAGRAVWWALGQKRAADRSADEAKRSADAAAEVAEIERARRGDEIVDAERRRVCFEFGRAGGRSYVLRHGGTDTAYGVHVDTGKLGVPNDVRDFAEWPAGEAQPFRFFKMDQVTADEVVVTWHHRPDQTDPPQDQKLLRR